MRQVFGYNIATKQPNVEEDRQIKRIDCDRNQNEVRTRFYSKSETVKHDIDQNDQR